MVGWRGRLEEEGVERETRGGRGGGGRGGGGGRSGGGGRPEEKGGVNY